MKKIIGSIIENGKIRPFIFDPETGELRLDENLQERNAPLTPAEENALRESLRRRLVMPPDEIRIGQYFCTVCRKWFEAAGELWSYGICLSCSLDRGSEMADWFDEQDQDG